MGLLPPCGHMLRIPTPVRAMALSVDTRSNRSYPLRLQDRQRYVLSADLDREIRPLFDKPPCDSARP